MAFPEYQHLLSLLIHLHLFEKKKINTERYQENTPGNAYFRFQVAQLPEQFSKYITDQQQGDIAGRYACHEGQPALVTVVQALLDNGKQYRAYCNA